MELANNSQSLNQKFSSDMRSKSIFQNSSGIIEGGEMEERIIKKNLIESEVNTMMDENKYQTTLY